jgi:hypothetical protein
VIYHNIEYIAPHCAPTEIIAHKFTLKRATINSKMLHCGVLGHLTNRKKNEKNLPISNTYTFSKCFC